MKPTSSLTSLVLILVCFAGCRPTDQTLEYAAKQNSSPNVASSSMFPPQSKDQLPEFVLPTLDGQSFDSSDQNDKVLLVNFWATWCAPCRVEIPDLITLQEELGSEDFNVIGISLDTDEPSFVREFVDAMEINYPILLDDGEVAEAFGGVYALPTTFVVDKKGKITHRTIGLFPVDAVKSELTEMITAD